MPRRDDDRRRRSRSRSRSPRRRRSRSPSRRRRSEDRHRREEPHDRDRGRLREERGREDRRYYRSPLRQQDPRAEAPSPGAICRGHVHTVKPFGVFVSLEGFGRHGLVHHSQISDDLSLGREDEDDDKITALEYFCPRGSQVWVKVLDVQREGSGGSARVSCSMRAVDQESGADLEPDGGAAGQPRRGGGGGGGGGGPQSSEPPELDSIHRATVASLRPFGAFVRIDGFRANGLVHVSQISDHMGDTREAGDQEKVAAIGEVLRVGEPVFVKVIEIKPADPGDERGPKVSCSIKLVSQRDGADLDPNGLKFRPRPAEGAGGGGFGQRRTVGADAGQAQGGVIDWGHLDAEKVNLAPKYGAGYELVGEEQQLPPPPPPGLLPPPPAGGAGAAVPGVGSVEEALAILRKHERRKKDKSGRKQKDKKAKKEKKEKRQKDKKRKKEAKEKNDKKSRKQASSSSSSDSD